MSYIFLSCNNNDKTCSYNIIEQSKYFQYLDTITDKKEGEDYRTPYVCGDKQGTVVQCCDKTKTELSDVYAKSVDGGYEVCNCSNDRCRKLWCKGHEKVDQYRACKLKGKDIDLPIVFDWENWDQYSQFKISFHTLNKVANAFTIM